MEKEGTVLTGCEVACIWPESELIACPLSIKEQEVCRERIQYKAGIKEVVDWVEERKLFSNRQTDAWCDWQSKLKEWRLES